MSDTLSTPAAAAVAALAAALAAGGRPGRIRLHRLVSDHGLRRSAAGAPRSTNPDSPYPPQASDHGRARSRLHRQRLVASVVAGVVPVLVLGAPGLAVAPLVAILLARWLASLPTVRDQRRREEMRATLPVAADLLVAALAAGTSPSAALQVVGGAIGGPLGPVLSQAATSLEIGSDPHAAWSALQGDPATAALARAFAGALLRGSSPVSRLVVLADDARAQRRWAAEARARGVGARAAAPLGLCFLPAFVLLGIVPLVVAAAAALP